MEFSRKNLVLEELPISNTKVRWKLKEPVQYKTSSNEIIEVPAGFITDLASIPRVLWALYAPFGKYQKAAVVHDFLYRKQFKTRKESDDIFYECMKVDGVSTGIRHLIFWFVRMFGWWAWKKVKQSKKSKK